MAAALNRRGGGFPAVQCDDFRGLMETIFTQEEARLAVEMPDSPVSLAMMAGQLGVDAEVAGTIMEGMARKGILFVIMHGGQRYYVLLPLIPGIIENQLMTGATDERARKIARLFAGYLGYLNNLAEEGRGIFPGVPFARVIAVEQDIPDDRSVQPHDRLLQYIEKSEHFGLVTCHCRHMYGLLGDPCDKPKDVCLAVGPGAKYMVDYGLAKQVSREEACHVLARAEEAGLVHVVSNTGKYLNFICNCCTCHCENLKSMKRTLQSGLAAVSSFIAHVDADECINCGDCTVRCPMCALSQSGEAAALDVKLCIGCGLCISVCQTGALKLRMRDPAPVPFPDSQRLNAAIVSSMNL